MRWNPGQRIDGTLLDYMWPEFDRVMARAGDHYPLMVCSGDVLLDFPRTLPPPPRGSPCRPASGHTQAKSPLARTNFFAFGLP